MSKREKRVFIITIEIKNECWDYKVGDIFRSTVVSNNSNNAIYSFKNHHSGSEYPFYEIIKVEDTFDSGFFMPNILSDNLL